MERIQKALESVEPVHRARPDKEDDSHRKAFQKVVRKARGESAEEDTPEEGAQSSSEKTEEDNAKDSPRQKKEEVSEAPKKKGNTPEQEDQKKASGKKAPKDQKKEDLAEDQMKQPASEKEAPKDQKKEELPEDQKNASEKETPKDQKKKDLPEDQKKASEKEASKNQKKAPKDQAEEPSSEEASGSTSSAQKKTSKKWFMFWKKAPSQEQASSEEVPFPTAEVAPEEIKQPEPLRPVKKKHTGDGPFAEEVRQLFEEEQALEREQAAAENLTSATKDASADIPREVRPNVEPGTFKARPEEEELRTKKVSSRAISQSAEEREAIRLQRQRERERRQSARQKRKEIKQRKQEKRQARRDSWRERSRKRREARERARKAKAVENARAMGTESDRHHWTTGLPVLERIYSWSQKRQQKKEKSKKKEPRLVAFLRKKSKERQAKQARKLWDDIVGLDIGSSYLRAVLVEKGEVVLAEREIPDGIVVRGLLEEPEELAEEIKSFWREEKIPSRKVNISFSNRLALLKTMDLQAESEDDIKQALALNVDMLVKPMKPEDVVIDYSQLSQSRTGSSLQIGAADQNMVKGFVDAVEEGGLVVAGAEIGPLVSSRSLRVPRKKDSAIVLLDIGAEITSFSVASGPDIFFLRSLEVGGNDFTRAIANATGLSWSEAEEMKRNLSDGEGLNKTELLAQRAISETADRFCREVAQTEELYKSSPRARVIEGYITLGGGSRLLGLNEQLKFVLNRQVSSDIALNPRFENLPIEQSFWVPALGLANGHSMSLLPARKGLKQRMRRTSKVSSEEAQERAKQLAPGRSRPLASKKLMIVLAVVLGLLGAFLWGELVRGGTESQSAEVRVLRNLIKEAPVSSESQEDKLQEALREMPSWSAVDSIFQRAERENIEVLEYFVLGRDVRLFFRDTRTLDQLEEIFKLPGASVSVQENSAGEKEVEIRL